ncbi:hypothetical protein BCR43DRAFT_488633 [Syncephalastrum racemosum]|uniref:CSD domain-containing protein n=1 Tax=Syncephalastrum racemosum TaxID=13706 RepID=A0A1X2HJ36_SYNRA|nr:hypothetical protein BCR43DRAFT_488633 [Syncephalastrum racemosum]
MAVLAKPTDTQPSSNRKRGRVKFFNSVKGYGFIVPEESLNGGPKTNNPGDKRLEEVFVHHTAIHNGGGFKSLAEGEEVEYDLIQGPKGYQAANVSGPNGTAVKGDPYAHRPYAHHYHTNNHVGIHQDTYATAAYVGYGPYGYSVFPAHYHPAFHHVPYPQQQHQQHQQHQAQFYAHQHQHYLIPTSTTTSSHMTMDPQLQQQKLIYHHPSSQATGIIHGSSTPPSSSSDASSPTSVATGLYNIKC